MVRPGPPNVPTPLDDAPDECDRHAMHCRACGYSLLSLDARRCPECGSTFDPADPTTFARFRRPRFIRIWMHVPLLAAATIAGWFGGALVGALVIMALLRGPGSGSPGIGVARLLLYALFFFGGAYAGVWLLTTLVIRFVPVNCSRCYGRAYYVREKRVGYRCSCCGHVQMTPIRTGQ